MTSTDRATQCGVCGSALGADKFCGTCGAVTQEPGGQPPSARQRLIAGVGAALVVMLVGGTGVWFAASRTESSASTAPVANTEPTAAPEPSATQGLKPFKTPPASAGLGSQAAAAPQQDRASSGDATYDTVLTGLVPDALLPATDAHQVRLRGGRAAGFSVEYAQAEVWLKGGDRGVTDTWRREAVRFADVAGDGGREAVVILGRYAGGVPWPDGVVVYDASGAVVFSWDTRDAGGYPRASTSFVAESGSSVDLIVKGADPSSSGAVQVGSTTYRLSKGADGKPTWTQIAKSRA